MTNKKFYYSESPENLFKALKHIAKEIGGIDFDDITKELTIATPPSFLSWGEIIHISVDAYKSGCVVTIDARAKVPFNITSNPLRYIKYIENRLNEIFGEGKIID